MIENCGECYRRWYCYIDPRECDKLTDSVSVTKEIDRAPTIDAVPVVRCRDCKHWHKDTVFCDYMSYGEAAERVNWYADDFCCYGERKEDK